MMPVMQSLCIILIQFLLIYEAQSIPHQYLTIGTFSPLLMIDLDLHGFIL